MTQKSFKSVPDRRFHRLAVIAALALVVGACDQQSNAPLNEAEAARTEQDANDASDPVLESALRDQIMVDPKLVQQANADALRPPAQPESLALPPETIADAAHKPVAGALRAAPAPSANCPQCASARRALTLGALAASQGGSADCVRNVRYSASWANRLPDAVPLYPDARVIEAAGADGNGCALRVVSFASAAPMQRLLDWYYTRTVDAGYRAGHGQDAGEHVLAGTREAAAFMVRLRPRANGGTNVDLMVDAPR